MVKATAAITNSKARLVYSFIEHNLNNEDKKVSFDLFLKKYRSFLLYFLATIMHPFPATTGNRKSSIIHSNISG